MSPQLDSVDSGQYQEQRDSNLQFAQPTFSKEQEAVNILPQFGNEGSSLNH